MLTWLAVLLLSKTAVLLVTLPFLLCLRSKQPQSETAEKSSQALLPLPVTSPDAMKTPKSGSTPTKKKAEKKEKKEIHSYAKSDEENIRSEWDEALPFDLNGKAKSAKHPKPGGGAKSQKRPEKKKEEKEETKKDPQEETAVQPSKEPPPTTTARELVEQAALSAQF